MKNQTINGYTKEIIVTTPKFCINPRGSRFLSSSLIPRFTILLFIPISTAAA